MPTTHTTLRNFNLNGGLKSKYLDVKATQISIDIEIDDALNDLIKAGKESLKISHLGDVAKAEVEKASKAFVATIQGIDTKLAKMLTDGEKIATEVKEANEVLTYYSKIVKSNVEGAVQREWQAYVSRRKHLSAFRVKCVTKIALGTIGLGVAVGSAVLSFGALWWNVCVAAKVVSDLVQTCKTWAQDLDDVYASLVKDIEKVDELNQQREKALNTKEAQKLSKTKEGLKELMNGVLPITKSMLKATSEVENTCKQYMGLVAKLENKADDIVGELNKAVKGMSKLPEKSMSPELKKIAAQVQTQFEKLFEEIADLHRKTQSAAKFGERAMKATKKLRASDSWGSLDPERSLDISKHGISGYSVANFLVQLLMNGKDIIALIPV